MSPFFDSYVRQIMAGDDFTGSGGAGAKDESLNQLNLLRTFIHGKMVCTTRDSSSSQVGTITAVSVFADGKLSIELQDPMIVPKTTSEYSDGEKKRIVESNSWTMSVQGPHVQIVCHDLGGVILTLERADAASDTATEPLDLEAHVINSSDAILQEQQAFTALCRQFAAQVKRDLLDKLNTYTPEGRVFQHTAAVILSWLQSTVTDASQLQSFFPTGNAQIPCREALTALMIGLVQEINQLGNNINYRLAVVELQTLVLQNAPEDVDSQVSAITIAISFRVYRDDIGSSTPSWYERYEHDQSIFDKVTPVDLKTITFDAYVSAHKAEILPSCYKASLIGVLTPQVPQPAPPGWRPEFN